MPRYFFDHYENGNQVIDDEGTICADLPSARTEAMRTLPSIAMDQVPKDGDRQAYVVHVRDEAGKSVYSATLTFAGVSLGQQ